LNKIQSDLIIILVNLHFQWKAFIFLLSELRYRTEGPKVDQAWNEIEKSYEYHPSFDKELSRRALPIAVNNLTMKAWEAYIAARGVPAAGEPYFIQLIRGRRKPTKSPDAGTQSSGLTAPVPQPVFTLGATEGFALDAQPSTNPLQSFDWNVVDFNASLGNAVGMAELAPLNYPEQMNWSTWDNLLVDFQTSSNDDMAMDFSTFNIGLQ
jgi:hypothetical protein